MRGARKLILLLTVLLLSLSLVSCEKDREYDEGEVISAARELLSLAKPINEIYYGKGLEYDPESGNGIYKTALEESLSGFGISSVEELKEKTLRVYSDERANLMFNTVLSSISDEGVIKHYTRYYDYTDGEGNSFVMVNSDYNYYLTGEIEYLDGIEVVDVEGEIIVISVPVRLTSVSGKVKNTSLEIRMIEESDGWRFTTASHAVYNESSDAYEDLLDKIK